MAEKKNLMELKKHVATIHAGNRMSLLQRKLANALLYNAYENLLEKEEHQIHIATLCEIIGYDSKDYKTIRRTLVELISTVIQWNLVDGDKLDSEGIWNASSIIASATIDGPICTYTYSSTMRKLLYHPELYGRLNMAVMSQFKSSYGLALYENCIRFQNIEQTPWLDIIKFRKLMGVEENKYLVFRDLKTRVIDKAIEEVNKYSPIRVTPHFKKEGRQMVAIQFKISKPESIQVDNLEWDERQLAQLLNETFGFTKKQIKIIMEKHDPQYILAKIKVVQSATSFQQGKIKNLAKYLMSAIEEDYQPNKTSVAVQPDRFEAANQKRVDQQKIERERRQQNKMILQRFEQLNEKEQKNILVDFTKQISKSVYGDIYERDGLKNLLVQDQFCHFVRQREYAFFSVHDKIL